MAAKIKGNDLETLEADCWPTQPPTGSTPEAIKQIAATADAPRKITNLPDDQECYETEETYKFAMRLKARIKGEQQK